MKNPDSKAQVVVPARMGSRRVKAKSLRHLNGRPLITYILRTLKRTMHLNDITINSDNELFATIAKEEGVGFYRRAPELATSESLIDEYIYDFIKKTEPEHLAVVNPTSPFIDAEQLDQAWLQYLASDCQTLLSCERVQTHCFLEGEAINFSTKGKHPRSQDLKPLLALNFAITIWDCAAYIENYENNGWGVYTGKLDFFETEGWASIDIDYPEDFALAELTAKLLESGAATPAETFPDFVNEYLEQHPDIEN